jgi:hypothetical protein
MAACRPLAYARSIDYLDTLAVAVRAVTSGTAWLSLRITSRNRK